MDGLMGGRTDGWADGWVFGGWISWFGWMVG